MESLDNKNSVLLKGISSAVMKSFSGHREQPEPIYCYERRFIITKARKVEFVLILRKHDLKCIS